MNKKNNTVINTGKEWPELIINTAPVGFILSIDGIVMEANEYAQKYMGIKPGVNAEKVYTDPAQREILIEQTMKQDALENRIIRCNMANGESHRFLAKQILLDYGKQKVFALWGMDIEENERQKDELSALQRDTKEMKERLERILNTAPISFILSKAGKVLEVNDTAGKATGLNVGDNILRIYSNPHERDRVVGLAHEHLFLDNEIVSINLTNGESRRCLLNAVAVEYEQENALAMWLIDVERGEEQKDQLRDAQESLQAMIDNMPIPVRLMDLENRNIIYANRSCLKLFEHASQEEACVHISETMPEFQSDGTPSHDIMTLMINSLDKAFSYEIDYMSSSGRIIHTLLTSVKINYVGRDVSVGLIRDLSGEKEHERMLLSAAEKEKEANQLKSRFLANMSHEIRTPMNVIIGLTEIELRKEQPKGVTEVYNKINQSAKNLLNIINDVLDLSKIEADKIVLYEDEFNLEDVIGNAIPVATQRLEGKNVEFLLNVSLKIPHMIKGDRTRLWQILKNLLDNAAKYTETGKIVLSAYVDKTKSNDETEYITFIVEDTGSGIDDDQISRIFLPYEQIYTEAQKRYTGTGLGMTISKQLCELMGGTMELKSKPGFGTTVRLNIPFKRVACDAAETNTSKLPDLSGVNVLAVDNDSLSLLIIYNILTQCGVNCEIANSGEKALEAILEHRSRNKSFDLVLLDYMMDDGWNGLDTAGRIQMSMSKAPKILMVTAYQKHLLKHDIKRFNIDDVIEKPLIPSQFIQNVSAAIGLGVDSSDEAETFTCFKDVHVLLCEDYKLNRDVANGMLAYFGISVEFANDGRQGLKLLNSGTQFDLIFMDLQMPVMDGFETAKLVRADKRFDHIPIISLTADAMKEVIDKCAQVGMNDHIAKPMEFDRLHQILLKWLPESKRVTGEHTAKPILVNEGLTRFGGNKYLYEQALLEFSQALPEMWPDFRSIVSDKEHTKRVVHKIKGAAGNLMEKEIYHCTVEFGNSLYNDEPNEEQYMRMISACNAYKRRINDQLKRKAVVSHDIGTEEEFLEKLNRLKEALTNYDLNKCTKALLALKEKSWPTVDEEKLQNLYNLTQSYEYDAALELIMSI